MTSHEEFSAEINKHLDRHLAEPNTHDAFAALLKDFDAYFSGTQFGVIGENGPDVIWFVPRSE